MAGSEGGRRWGRRGPRDEKAASEQREPEREADAGAQQEGGAEQGAGRDAGEGAEPLEGTVVATGGPGTGPDGPVAGAAPGRSGAVAEPGRGGAGAAVGAGSGSGTGAGPRGVEVDVFVGPESAFFATSALVYGASEAVLVDTQLTLAAGRELAEWVAGKARRLTAVVITHPHPDHYFGTAEILRMFPDTPVYAVPEVIDGIIATGLAKVARWQPVFGDDLTAYPVVPGPLPGHRLRVDGTLLDVLAFGQGDCAACSVVHVPAADTVVAGDLVYNGTHLWTAETTPAERADWLANLEALRGLGASRVVAGHRAPGRSDDAEQVIGFTAGYLRAFDARLALHPDDASALVAAMNTSYAELTLPVLLELSAEAATRPAR